MKVQTLSRLTASRVPGAGKFLLLNHCSYHYAVSIVGTLNPSNKDLIIFDGSNELGIVAIGHKYACHGERSDKMGRGDISLKRWFEHDHNSQLRRMRLVEGNPNLEQTLGEIHENVDIGGENFLFIAERVAITEIQAAGEALMDFNLAYQQRPIKTPEDQI